MRTLPADPVQFLIRAREDRVGNERRIPLHVELGGEVGMRAPQGVPAVLVDDLVRTSRTSTPMKPGSSAPSSGPPVGALRAYPVQHLVRTCYDGVWGDRGIPLHVELGGEVRVRPPQGVPAVGVNDLSGAGWASSPVRGAVVRSRDPFIGARRAPPVDIFD